MSQLVFAYGSNMCTGRFRIYRVTPERRGQAALLLGYRLSFNKKSTKDGSGKANVELYDGGQVWGVVFTISDNDLTLLDEGEKGYVKVKLPVQVGGDTVDCLVYVAEIPENNQVLRPYSWYKRFLLEGAKEHGINAQYIAELEQIVATQDKNEKRDREMRAVVCDG